MNDPDSSLNKETELFVGFGMPGQRKEVKGKSDQKVFVAGREINLEEQNRVKQVLHGLRLFIRDEKAKKLTFGAATPAEEDEGNKFDPDEYAENDLTNHQAMRQEIVNYWNKFSMIQIVPNKIKVQILNMAEIPEELDGDESQGNILGGYQ
jgi:hypothetical protein